MDVEYDFDETVFNIVRCNWADEVEDSIELELLSSNSTGSDMSTSCTYNPTPAQPAMPLNLIRSGKHVAKGNRSARGAGGAGKVRLVKERPCQKVNVGDKKQQKKKKTKGPGGESRGSGSEKRKKSEDRPKGSKGGERGSGKQVPKLGGSGSGANKRKESASRSGKDSSPHRRTQSQPLPLQQVQQQEQHKAMTTPLLEKRGSRADTSSDWNMDKIKAVHSPSSPSKSPDSARRHRRGSATNRSSGSSTSRSGCSTARSVASRADTEEWTRPLRVNTDSSRSDSSRRSESGRSKREMFHKRNR
ncbi:hypothetical protein BSKO_08205 [Bryopsis sp. KO-2023]|nr:hypothetical protein BSKO_08205 [Bryopsis sp. KO-2023]